MKIALKIWPKIFNFNHVARILALAPPCLDGNLLIYFRFSGVIASHLAEHDSPGQALVSRPSLLLPALLGRETDSLHPVGVPRSQKADVQLQRHHQNR